MQYLSLTEMTLGTRIDFILSSTMLATQANMASVRQNILGSDHCPVQVDFILPTVPSPTTGTLLSPLCTRAYPEFSGVQTKLSTFFSNKASSSTPQATVQSTGTLDIPPTKRLRTSLSSSSHVRRATSHAESVIRSKRSQQMKLSSFLAPKAASVPTASIQHTKESVQDELNDLNKADIDTSSGHISDCRAHLQDGTSQDSITMTRTISSMETVVQTWKTIFSKPNAPRCYVHNEPCRQYISKKPGVNQGRRFWVCSR
jgi:AP endonuclease-2